MAVSLLTLKQGPIASGELERPGQQAVAYGKNQKEGRLPSVLLSIFVCFMWVGGREGGASPVPAGLRSQLVGPLLFFYFFFDQYYLNRPSPILFLFQRRFHVYFFLLFFLCLAGQVRVVLG